MASAKNAYLLPTFSFALHSAECSAFGSICARLVGAQSQTSSRQRCKVPPVLEHFKKERVSYWGMFCSYRRIQGSFHVQCLATGSLRCSMILPNSGKELWIIFSTKSKPYSK